jgi:trk system potassium uptake protein TrkA
MYVVINGGGKVGSHLGSVLVAKGNDVAMIEKRPAVIQKLAAELPSRVLLIEGDGCNLSAQEDAGVENADVFISVTGEDEQNLVACQLARVRFKVKRAIGRVNNPTNELIFNALGVEAVSATTVISQLIEKQLSAGEVLTHHILERGRLVLVEIAVPGQDCPVCDRKIADLTLPSETVLVAVARGSQVIVPKGETTLERGDQVFAVTSIDNETELTRLFTGR